MSLTVYLRKTNPAISVCLWQEYKIRERRMAELSGLYALVQRVLAAPVDLITRCIMTLFIGVVSELLRKDIKVPRKLYLKSIDTLFLVGLITTLVLIIYADPDTLYALIAYTAVIVFQIILSLVMFFQIDRLPA